MRRNLIACLVILMASPVAVAQKGPDRELGFQPGKLYQFDKLDSVNLFNGNLTVTLPLGVPYRVGGDLTYQFSLAYNGNVWDYEDAGASDSNTYLTARPNLRSNAGMGWRISLGRLLSPQNTTAYTGDSFRLGWMYEGPTGDEHVFATLAGEIAGHQNDEFLFNRELNLRMRRVNSTLRTIEFPNGETHTFVKLVGDDWFLTEITDRFDNWVRIAYLFDSHDADSKWTVTDSAGRTHVLDFVYKSLMAESSYHGATLTSASLAGLSPAYTFTYDEVADIPVGCANQNPDLVGPLAIPMLASVSLPDGTSYGFEYQKNGVACAQGALGEITLPTGGTYSYEYQQYRLYTSICSEPQQTMTPGVQVRTTPSGGRWTYIQTVGDPVVPPGFNPNTSGICGYGEGGNPNPITLPRRWSRTTVLAPPIASNDPPYPLRRARTDHYFMMWAALQDPMAPQGTSLFFGYPGPSAVPAATLGAVADGGADIESNDGPAATRRFLETRTFDQCADSDSGACTNGSHLQSTWVRYEGAGGIVRQSTRSVAEDDSGCSGSPCWFSNTLTEFDGSQHYRREKHESNFPLESSKETFTDYPSWSDAEKLNVSKPWIFTRFDSITRTHGTRTDKVLHCFDENTGFLNAKRFMLGSTAQSPDVLVRFNVSARGEADKEYWYGGDQQFLSSADCLADPGSPQYEIRHTYTNGTLAASEYYDPQTELSVGFKSLDHEVDPVLGVIKKSKDTAGVQTTYAYDAAARLSSISSPAGATTTFTYTNASTGVTPKVDITTTASGVTLRSQRIEYDNQGRIFRESTQLPDGKWSVQVHHYDLAGHEDWTSVPELSDSLPTSTFTPTNKTIFSGFDAFGRVRTITAPDGKRTLLSYKGNRVRERTVTINTSLSSTTRETYDSLGRLTKVHEPGTDGTLTTPSTTTTYSYDIADRLMTVTMDDGITTPPQERSFTYDNRGFLTEERYPEQTGATTYTGFDARGHPTFKLRTSPDIYDLKFSYDKAERLEQIESRNPLSPSTFRLSKEFRYGTSSTGNLSLGKLEKAIRHNYHPNLGDFVVTETFVYNDVAGRVSDKMTEILFSHPSVPIDQKIDQTYQYTPLDEVKKIVYPRCEYAPPARPGCGATASTEVNFTHGGGRLTSVSGFATLSYGGNQMLTKVAHSNFVEDVITPDPTGMSRPHRIKFSSYAACSAPSFNDPMQPADQTVMYGNSTVLSVSTSGFGPIAYQWYSGSGSSATPIVGATNSWYSTPALTATQTYSVRAFNDCGTITSRTTTITVTLPAPTNLVASMTSLNQVSLTWNASQSAQSYTIYRRDQGSGFYLIAQNVLTTNFADITSAGSTFVYHVRAVNGSVTSPPGNSDLATTMTFSPIIAGQTVVSAVHLEEGRAAVNSVRGAAGLQPLEWPSILPPGIPAPASGTIVYGNHVVGLRLAMDVALEALELPLSSYTDPSLEGVFIKAVHLTELWSRTQ